MSTGTLIYGLATLGTGVLGVCVRYAFKSKCRNVQLCCGLITIERDTDAEVTAEALELRQQQPQQQTEGAASTHPPIDRQESNVSL
jgi:hypothetical protein